MRLSLSLVSMGWAVVLCGCTGTSAPVAPPMPAPTPAAPATPASPDVAANPPAPSAALDTPKPNAPKPDAPATPADELGKLLARGAQSINERQFDAATEAFEQAYKINPKDPRVLSGLGLAIQLQGQVQLQMGNGPDANDFFLKSAKYYHELFDVTKSVPPQTKQQAATAIYNEACVFSQRKEAPKALSSLEEALDLGFANIPRQAQLLDTDPDLDSIRDDPKFKELLAKFVKAPSSGRAKEADKKQDAEKKPAPEKKAESEKKADPI
jgi:tetratricopeptide (TPR) repeat protein